MQRSHPTRREQACLLLLAAFACFALFAWKPARYQIAETLAFRSPAPPDDLLSDLAANASNPAAFIIRLWNTGKIPHRQFVLEYVGGHSSASPALFHDFEPVILDASLDPDIEVRQLAFAALARLKHPQLRRLALEQLPDADPAVRLIGLQSLRCIASSNDVPIGISLLNDPEPRVVVAAALLLCQATRLNFGIKSTHALPQFTCIDTNPPPAPDLEAINQGVQRWREWWNAHQAEYPEPPPASAVPTQTIRLPTPDFSLPDSTGKRIQLSQFRGRSVLLAFWSPGAPASMDDAPALKALKESNPDRLAVLGVCIPAAPSCGEEHEPGHDQAHHHHHESAGGIAGAEHMRCSVQDAVTRLNISYPMLMDAKGSIGLRFHIEDLPAYVLIDPEGFIRRRFVGFRTEADLARMLEQVAGSTATPSSAAQATGFGELKMPEGWLWVPRSQ